MARVKSIIRTDNATGRVVDAVVLRPAPREELAGPVPARSGGSALGLGDVVARFAKPIAQVIDRVAGTKLAAGCGPCSRRRKRLNRWVPDLRRPWRRR